MALIKCKECGKELSDKANSCPNCGCPIDNNTALKCEECGNDLEKYDRTCQKCGCPVKENKSNHKKEYKDLTRFEQGELAKEMAKKGLWWDVVMFVLIIAVVLSVSFHHYPLAVISIIFSFWYPDVKLRKYYYKHKYEDHEK